MTTFATSGVCATLVGGRLAVDDEEALLADVIDDLLAGLAAVHALDHPHVDRDFR